MLIAEKNYFYEIRAVRDQLKAAMTPHEWAETMAENAAVLTGLMEMRDCTALVAAEFIVSRLMANPDLQEGEKDHLMGAVAIVAFEMMGPDFISQLTD